MSWFLARFREPSTWRGLVWLLTALGVSLSPDAWAHITTIGMAVAGLIGVLTREETSRTIIDVQLPPVELIGRAGMAERPDPLADRRTAPAGELRPPVRSIHNTDEAADIHDDFPGWGS